MWFYVPGLTTESSPVAPVLADSISASSSLAPDRELSVTSSGKLMQPRHLYAAWKKGRLTELRSGLTSLPSTAADGVDSWIASSVATHASPSAWPASAREKLTNAGSGPTSPESSESFDLSGCSLRTSPTTYVWDSCASTMTFDKWATGLRRACSRRRKWARAMRECGSSSWPTVLVAWGGRKNSAEEIANKGTGEKGKRQLTLESVATNWMKQWATVTVCGNHNRTGASESSGDGLSTQAKEWIKKWSTVMTRDYRTGSGPHGQFSVPLNEQVVNWTKELAAIGEQWATVRASDGEKGGPNQSFGAGGMPLTTQACLLSRLLLTILTGGSECSPDTLNSALQSLRLNPLFCEWLMGWCLGHTGSEVAETEWCRWWQVMRGQLWSLHCATMRMNNSHCFELTTD